MIKIEEMDDLSVIRYCHRYCEENNLTNEFKKYREEVESDCVYCSYLQDYISEGFCYDVQMVANGFIKKTVLPEIQIDTEALQKHCVKCKYQL